MDRYARENKGVVQKDLYFVEIFVHLKVMRYK